MTKKLTEDEWRAGLRISDARVQALRRARFVGDGSDSPPCNKCSFYEGATRCEYYPKTIPKAFLVGDHICGRYLRRMQDASK